MAIFLAWSYSSKWCSTWNFFPDLIFSRPGGVAVDWNLGPDVLGSHVKYELVVLLCWGGAGKKVKNAWFFKGWVHNGLSIHVPWKKSNIWGDSTSGMMIQEKHRDKRTKRSIVHSQLCSESTFVVSGAAIQHHRLARTGQSNCLLTPKWKPNCN